MVTQTVKVQSGAVDNPVTEPVFEGQTETRERNDAQTVQRPVQVHLVALGEIESGNLRTAWRKIVERLSTANGAGEQVNGNGNGNGHGVRRAPWQEHDLRGLPRDQARKWISAFLETDAQQGISSQRFPPTRCALLLTDKTECELVWSLHPALSARLDIEQALSLIHI